MDGEIELGPKMLACSERERVFVVEFLNNRCRDASDAARLAGYVDNDNGAIRVRGHQLRHRPRVKEAMQEVAREHYGGLLLPAVLAAEDLVENGKHPDHAKTVLAILSAHGLGEQQHVVVEKRDQSGTAMMKRLEQLAGKFGLDPAALLAGKLLALTDQRVSRETTSAIDLTPADG